MWRAAHSSCHRIMETYCSEGSGIQKEAVDSKYSYRTATVVVKQIIKRAFGRMPLFYAFFTILIKVINNECGLFQKVS